MVKKAGATWMRKRAACFTLPRFWALSLLYFKVDVGADSCFFDDGITDPNFGESVDYIQFASIRKTDYGRLPHKKGCCSPSFSINGHLFAYVFRLALGDYNPSLQSILVQHLDPPAGKDHSTDSNPEIFPIDVSEVRACFCSAALCNGGCVQAKNEQAKDEALDCQKKCFSHVLFPFCRKFTLIRLDRFEPSS